MQFSPATNVQYSSAVDIATPKRKALLTLDEFKGVFPVRRRRGVCALGTLYRSWFFWACEAQAGLSREVPVFSVILAS